jgi:hypothetical protein
MVAVGAGCCRTQDTASKSDSSKSAPDSPLVLPSETARNSPDTGIDSAALFDGAPDPSIRFSKTLRNEVFRIQVPEGWTGADDLYEGMVLTWNKADTAFVVVHHIGVGPVSDKNVAFWLKIPAIGGKEIQWQSAQPSRLGIEHIDVPLSRGNGLLKGQKVLEHASGGAEQAWISHCGRTSRGCRRDDA